MDGWIFGLSHWLTRMVATPNKRTPLSEGGFAHPVRHLKSPGVRMSDTYSAEGGRESEG